MGWGKDKSAFVSCLESRTVVVDGEHKCKAWGAMHVGQFLALNERKGS